MKQKKIVVSDSFQWAKNLIPILKHYEDDGVAFYQVAASHADIRNRNGRIYTSKELQNSAASLSERPLNINHDDKRMLPFPENQVVAARYENGVVECIIQVADPKVQKQIESGEINHVSIEGLYFDESNNTNETEYPTSLHFRALALLTKDDEPGDPDARILKDHAQRSLFVNGEIKEKLSLKDQGPTATFQTSEDEQVCDNCSALDGNVYPANNVPSSEQPPIHPNCRCTLIMSSMPDDSLVKITKKVKKRLEQNNISEAEWTTAEVNDLPDSAFAYVEPGGKKDDEGKAVPRSLRHLPYKGPDGKVDLPHLRNALARLSQTQLPAAAKSEARNKLVAAAKAAGINTSLDESLSRLASATLEYKIAREVALSILDDMDMDSDADRDPIANPQLKHPAPKNDQQDYDGRSTVQLDPKSQNPKGQQTLEPTWNTKVNPQASMKAPLGPEANPQSYSSGSAVKMDPADESPQNPRTKAEQTLSPNMTFALELNPLAITNQPMDATAPSGTGLYSAIINATTNTSSAPLVHEKKTKPKLSVRLG